MAKVSPVSIKYMVYATFSSQGPVEKPDVIGAIFGQTEGLLGAELEMRELQKEGKIGRIEVDLNTIDGKSVGEIRLPSALDKSETTIIAATLETIDRIGPTEAKIEVTKIEDVRGNKRDYIIDRAKKLLEQLDSSDNPEMAKNLKEESRAARIQEYGEEKLPAGDLSSNEVIVVEGRADVVNLLKNRVNNVIGMDGAKLPRGIAKLGEQKELTLFVDGDRGGKLIAKNVISNATIMYVAVAPDGKEVEELTGKEILMALRKRVPVEDFMKRIEYTSDDGYQKKNITTFEGDIKALMRQFYKEIKNTKKTILLSSSGTILRTIATSSAAATINRSQEPILAVIVDGQAVSSIVYACEEKGIKYLGATNFASVQTSINLVSL